MEKISREFIVKRGDANVIYSFETYPFIFNAKPKDPAAEAILNYLRKVFIEGIPDPSAKKSVTECPPLILQTERVKNEMVKHALKADYRNCGRGQHHRVQHQMLKYDPLTIAIEVPVFDDELNGHIDILRICNGKIQVLDFKPLAHKERKAASQVYRYILLLAKALKLPLSCFEGYYFDDCNAYRVAF